jgi:hypothetical protein
LWVLKPQRQGQALGELAVFAINLPRGLQEELVVWRDEQADARDHVQADAGVGVDVDVGDDRWDRFEFEEKVHRIGFAIVREEERDET